MSYSERDNQVVLSMSREDYDFLTMNLGACLAAQALHRGSILAQLVGLMNRLNEGNPNYTPYQVANGKARS